MTYDILPLPTSFSIDRNVPSPAKRLSLQSLSQDVNTHVGRKVRLYGTVFKYVQDQDALYVTDRSSSSPYPIILVSTGIILSQSFAPLGTESSYGPSSGSKSSYQQDRESKALENELEYSQGRYPAGSGRDLILPPPVAPNPFDMEDVQPAPPRHEQGRIRAGLRLEPGESVCVVGWVERSSEVIDTSSNGRFIAGIMVKAIFISNVALASDKIEDNHDARRYERDNTELSKREGLDEWD